MLTDWQSVLGCMEPQDCKGEFQKTVTDSIGKHVHGYTVYSPPFLPLLPVFLSLIGSAVLNLPKAAAL